MAFIRCMLDFEMGKRGWSEIYFLSQDPANLDDAIAATTRLCEKRAPMLGKQAIINRISCSVEGIRGDAAVESLENDPYVGQSGYDCASPDLAILVRKDDATGRRHSNSFLRGFFDDLEIQGGRPIRTTANETAYDAWINAYTPWKAWLKSKKFGWPAADAATSPPKQITSLSLNLTNQVEVTTEAGLFLTGETGKKQRVRLSGVKGVANLNGVWVVQANSTNTFTIIDKVPIFTWENAGTATVTRYTFLVIDNVELVRCTRRKCGRPKGVSPGKRRARVLT